MSRVFGGLYIGSTSLDSPSSVGVSHLLTVHNSSSPPPPPPTAHLPKPAHLPTKRNKKKYDSDEEENEEEEGSTHLEVYLEDSPSSNLLMHLDTTYNFIDNARSQGNGVLIVCSSVANSASASLCIAYITKKLGVSLKDAYGLVKDAKRTIRPNDGFVKQLKDYYSLLHEANKETYTEPSKDASSEETDSKAPVTPLPTPTAPLPTTAPSTSETISTTLPVVPTELTEPTKDTTTEGLTEIVNSYTTDHDDTEVSAPKEPEGSFHCKKCRLLLFRSADVTAHLQGNGQNSFSWHKRSTKQSDNECTSLFITDRMDWMGDVSAIDGKLSCPKCNGRVGSWRWNGDQCSCGAWQTPFFQVLKTRVDFKPAPRNMYAVAAVDASSVNLAP